MDTIGSRLRHARQKAGFKSARSAAIRFGWIPSTYAAHENGQNDVTNETAARYAAAYKIDLIWLVMGDGFYRTERFAPVIGIAHAPNRITYKVPLNEILANVWTVKRSSIIAIARTYLAEIKGFVTFQVISDGMRPRFADGDLIVALFGDENYKDEDVLCHFDQLGTHLCYAIDLRRVDGPEGGFLGDIVDSQGVVRKQVRVAHVWTIMLVVPARGWDLYTEDEGRWENALTAIEAAPG